MIDYLHFDIQAVLRILKSLVVSPRRPAARAPAFRARAPKISGALQIARLAVDDESADSLLLCIACSKFRRTLQETSPMKYLHTMVRVTDIEQSLRFYRDALGLQELSRRDHPKGRFTLVFLAAPGMSDAQVELTHNWDPETYQGGRNFGHLAYAWRISTPPASA
jgi:hypothetical protein